MSVNNPQPSARKRKRTIPPPQSQSNSLPGPRLVMILKGNELKHVQNMIKNAKFGNELALPKWISKYFNPIGNTCQVRGGPPFRESVGVRQWHQNNVPKGYYNTKTEKWIKINQAKPFISIGSLPSNVTWPPKVVIVYPHGAAPEERTQIKANQSTFAGENARPQNRLNIGAVVAFNGNIVHRAPSLQNTPLRLGFVVK